MTFAPRHAAAVTSHAVVPPPLAVDAASSPAADGLLLPPSVALPLPPPVFDFTSSLPQLSPAPSPAYLTQSAATPPPSLLLPPVVSLLPALSSPAVLMLAASQQSAGSRERDARLRSQPARHSESQEMEEQEEAGVRLHSHLSIDGRDGGSGRRYSASSQAASPPLVSSPALSPYAADENGGYLRRLQQQHRSSSVSETPESLSPTSLSQSRGSPARDRALPAGRSVMVLAAVSAATAQCDMCEAAVAEWFCCQCELRMCQSDLDAHARLYAVGHQLHELRQHREEEDRRQHKRRGQQQQLQSSGAAQQRQQQVSKQQTGLHPAAGADGSMQRERHQVDVSSLVRAEVEQQILQITYLRTEEERLLVARKQAAGVADGRGGRDAGSTASHSGQSRGGRLPSHPHVGSLDTPSGQHRLMPLASQRDDIVRRWESLQDDLPRLYPKQKRNAAVRPAATGAASSSAASSSLLPPQAESSRLDLQHLLPIAARLTGRSLSAVSPSQTRQTIARVNSPHSPVASPVNALMGRREEKKAAMQHSNGSKAQTDASLPSRSTRPGLQRSRSSGLLLAFEGGAESQERSGRRPGTSSGPVFELLSADATTVANQRSQRSVSVSDEESNGSEAEQQLEQQRWPEQRGGREGADDGEEEEAEEEKAGFAAPLSYPSDIPQYRSVVLSEQSQAAAAEPMEDGGYAATGWASDGRHARLAALATAGETASREQEAGPEQELQDGGWQQQPHLSAYMRENRERFMQAMQREEKEGGRWQPRQQRLHYGAGGDQAELSSAARDWEEDEDLNAAVWVEDDDEAEAEQAAPQQQQAQAHHARRPQSPPASSPHHAHLLRAFSRVLLYLDSSLPSSHYSASSLRSLDSDISLLGGLLQRVLDRRRRRWPTAAKSWPSMSVPLSQPLRRRDLRASPPVRPVGEEIHHLQPRAPHSRPAPAAAAPEVGRLPSPSSHRSWQAEAASHVSARPGHSRQPLQQRAEAKRSQQLHSQRQSRKHRAHRPRAAPSRNASVAAAARTAPAVAASLSTSSSAVDASHGAIHHMPDGRSRSHSHRQPQRRSHASPPAPLQRSGSPLVTVSASGVMIVLLPQAAHSGTDAQGGKGRRKEHERRDRQQDAVSVTEQWADALDTAALPSQPRFAELDSVMPRSTAKVR